MIDVKLNKNWLQQRVDISGENSAVFTSSGKITYKQLADKVNSTAYSFVNQDINKNDRVGLLFSNSADFIICIYSLWQAGAVPVPLNLRLSSSELEKQIEFSKIKLLVIEEGLKGNYDDIEFQDKVLFSADVKSSSIINSSPYKTNEENTALILFTSGSTDKPKAVELTFSNLYHSAKNIDDEINFTCSDIFLAALPFYHIGGFSIIIRALLSGGSIAINNSLKSDDILSGIKSFKPTIISLVSTQLKRIVDANEKPHSNLRCVFIGGGPIDKMIIKKALQLGWEIFIVYGSTETSSMVTMLKPNEIPGRFNCAGKAISNNRVLIKDAEGETLNRNTEGRIHIISKSVMKRYLNTSGSVHNEYMSDDRGYLDDDGFLFVTGRIDDIIISGGENINCRQVDNTIQTHPNILDSFSFGVKDPEWGQMLCAVIVPLNAENYSEKELRTFLKSKLADFKIPKKIIQVEHLPKNDLGKVEKNKLMEKLQSNFD